MAVLLLNTLCRLRSLGIPGVLPIIDVLKYDPKYQRVMEYVCGSTLVCNDLDTARKIAFGRKERHKVVTKDGTLIRKSGLMTGGISGVEAKAAKWDDKQIESMYFVCSNICFGLGLTTYYTSDLKQQRDKCMQELTEITQSLLSSGPREQQLRGQLTTLRTRYHALKYDQDTTRARIRSNREESARIERDIDKLKAEIAKVCCIKN